MATIKTLRDNTRRDRARRLRREDTDAEARLWSSLRDRRLGGWKWRRQVPLGPYIVDFLCVEAGLVVELDGGQHADQMAYDARRTRYLEGLGLRVMGVIILDVPSQPVSVIPIRSYAYVGPERAALSQRESRLRLR